METGQTPKVATNKVEIDFSKLFKRKNAENSPSETRNGEGQYKNTTETQKPVQSKIDTFHKEQAKTLYLKASKEKEAYDRSVEVYKTYQKNVKTSSELQTEILKGLKNGEDVYNLFLKAAKCISLMTANGVFYDQVKGDLQAIYGRGLQQKPPLQAELQEIQDRLQRLKEAQAREAGDSKERVRKAVQAHEEQVSELTAMIAEAE